MNSRQDCGLILIFMIINQNLSMSQQYYLHEHYLSYGQHSNLSSITLNSSPMLIMAQCNSILLYEYSPNGITLIKTVQFHCNIKKMIVLPNKHQNSDYLFILDDRGRYAFLQIDGGFQLIQNHINVLPQHLQLYKVYTHTHQRAEFCQHTHYFQVLDTRGSIFFNQGQEIIVLDYSMKLMGLKVEKPKRIKLDVIKYRYAGWVQNVKHERWLGLIEQVQEKTILKVYNLDKLLRICSDNLLCQFQKTNLLQFASPSQNKLLALTQNQITLLELISMNTIATYSIKDTFGQLLVISPDIYGYLGQELMLFSQKKMQSFGSLCLKDQNILTGKGIAEVRSLRELADGGNLIGIITYTNQIYIVILYGNTWKLAHKMDCMTPVFSMTQLNNGSLLAVLNKGVEQYQVNIIEREMIVGFTKQQKYESIIEKIVSINDGKLLVVATKQQIQVLKQEFNSNEFQQTRIKILNQELLTAYKNFITTTKSIYFIDDQRQLYQKIYSDQIILAEASENQIIFMNGALQVNKLLFDTKQITHVRQAAANQYIWHLLDDVLVVGRSDDLEYLQLYSDSELINKIQLKHAALVSSIAHITTERTNNLIIGFTDGYISVIDLESCLIVNKFQNFSSQPIYLQTINNSIFISSKQKHFLFNSYPEISFKQISLTSSQSTIESITYLSHRQQIILAQKLADKNCSTVKTVSWEELTSNEKTINRTYTYQKHAITSFSQQIPIVYAEGTYIYVAVSKQIQIYNSNTRACHKIIHNFYSDVIGIQRIEYGILVYGIDQLSRNILTIIDPKTLQPSPTITLILKDNKYIKSIKSLGENTNRVLCRGEKYITIYQISDTFEINQVNQFKSDFQGYSLDINPTNQTFAITDSYRFAAFYTYKEGILPIARYVGEVEINQLCLIDRAVVVADRAGKILVLQFNVQNQNAPLKMMMTKVCSINVGDQICCLNKLSQNKVIYSTINGSIGIIKIITEYVFSDLKQVEIEFLQERSKYSEFDYKKWRNRQQNDKLIDCELVGQFLQQKYNRAPQTVNQPRFRQINQVYQSIKS